MTVPGRRGLPSPRRRGFARWRGDEAARRAVTNNRARLLSQVARQAFKLRAEIVRTLLCPQPRSWRHATNLAARARERAQALPALHVAGHNLSLLMRQLIGAGNPEGGRGTGIYGHFPHSDARRSIPGHPPRLAERSARFRHHISAPASERRQRDPFSTGLLSPSA